VVGPLFDWKLAHDDTVRDALTHLEKARPRAAEGDRR
jgi:hypothetical protein